MRLLSLFSKCFELSCIPSSWSKAIISPIPKSVINYRGISLLCGISQLYSSLLNNRLTSYFDTLNLFSDLENSFRKKHFVKTMHMYFPSGISTYVSFIDFDKAFDWIPRYLFLYKLLSYNVDGIFYNAIKSMYSNTTSSVKLNKIIANGLIQPQVSGKKILYLLPYLTSS